MAVLAAMFAEFLLYLIGASDQLIADGSTYMRVQFIAVFFSSLQFTSGTVLQASGDTLTPMKAQLVNRVIHLSLAPLLMFGLGPFPELGLVGASVATLLAQSVGAAMNFRVLMTGHSRLRLTFANFRLDLPLIWRMVRIGTPASITNMERSTANLIVVGLIAVFGDLTLAAYSIVQRMQMFANLGSQGMGQASGIIVGQSLGAKRPERARETVWWALAYVSLMNGVVAGVIFLFPSLFLSVFTRDAALLDIAVPWLQILVLSFFVQMPGMVFQQVFNTAGDTFIPMVVILGSMWFIELPVAIVLSGVGENWSLFGFHIPLPAYGDLGSLGIAWAIAIAMASRMVFYFPYFIWGPWMNKKVL